MAKGFLAVLLVLAAAVGALWYWVHKPQSEALVAARADTLRFQSEATQRTDELRTLQGRVADLETIRAELQKASAELQQKVAEKEAELSALKGTQDELLGELKNEIAAKQIQVERYRDQLRVDLVDEVLFDSGEAELKPAGQAVIRRVGDILKKTEGRPIEVQGHTDNVPIVGALAKRYPTNWELSAARAVNVARFLQEAGVAPEKLSATGYSEFRPRADNGTEQGKRKNRRIEILLGAKVVPEGAQAP